MDNCLSNTPNDSLGGKIPYSDEPCLQDQFQCLQVAALGRVVIKSSPIKIKEGTMVTDKKMLDALDKIEKTIGPPTEKAVAIPSLEEL